MKTKRIIIVIVSVVLVLLLAWYLWGPASVPPGQEPLTVLSEQNIPQFQAAFDSAGDTPRLVLLLSPT
jgi:hypothetical protein